LKTSAALLVLLALVAAPALAQTPDTVFLEELTWPELRALVAAGKTTIILPIGGTEQNGPAMALGKHNRRVKLLSERIAVSLGNALVAPVIAYVPEGNISPPSGHMRFPGTISVPDAAFETILEYAARSFKQHGFKDIIFLGDHGGYQKSMARAAASLNREWAKTPVRAHAIEDYYTAADKDFAQYLKGKGFTAEEIGTHAGLADTSLAMAVNPALVRADQLRAAPRGKADGVHGDPKRASAELGKAGLDLIVERSVASIQNATARR